MTDNHETLTDGSGFREEVVNVKLAELLEKRDVVSLPEQIVSNIVEGRRMPDIMTANYLGVRIVIEGRIGQNSTVRNSLEVDCQERVEEGIAPMAIAVAYPEGIQSASSLTSLEEEIIESEFELNVLTESGSSGWTQGDISRLAGLLRGGYSDLVQENVVDEAVETIESGIDGFVNELSSGQGLTGTAERLEEVVIVPNR